MSGHQGVLKRAAVVMLVLASGTLAARHALAQNRDDGYLEDGVRLGTAEPPPPWARPVDVVDASKWDIGGAALVPSLQVPIFVTDPFATSLVGQSAETALGIGAQWRGGIAVGRVSFLALGGYASISRSDARLPNGTSGELSLSRAYLGGEMRYTLATRGIVHPFLGAGATADYWNAPRIFRAGRRSAEVEGMWTPSVFAATGVMIRVARLGSRAAIFVEAGAYATYTFEGSVFTESQLAIAPYLGIDVLGLFGGKT